VAATVGHLAYQAQHTNVADNTVTPVTPRVEKDLVAPSISDRVD
jgi:hypothetical protein